MAMNTEYAESVIKRLSRNIGYNARSSIQADLDWIFENRDAWMTRSIPGLSTKTFNSFREFLLHRTPWGLGWTIKTAEAMILPEYPNMWKEVEDGIEPALECGTNRFTKESKNIDMINHIYKQGSSREYRISVLKRDAPEVAERVIKGEISARQGMIMTGKMIPTSVVQRTVDGYFKCAKRDLSVHDRQELANMLIEDNLNFKK